MLFAYSSKLLWAFEELNNTRLDILTRQMGSEPGSETIGETNANFLKRMLPLVAKYCAATELNGAKHLAEHFLSQVAADMNSEAGDAKIDSLQSMVRKELEERLFLLVPKDRATYYKNKNLCGEAVPDKFPGSVPDIIEAGNCYALERPTACVFHLMRVLPYGMEELSKKLGVAYSTDITALDWYGIIQPIEKAIREHEQGTKKSAAKLEDMKHYSEIVQHLYFCKDAWRNHVSHGRDPYDMPKAMSVMDHTAMVMQMLAARM